MELIRVSAPLPLLTVAEVKRHLSVEHDDDDLLIDALIQAATDNIDGVTGWLGRALGVQTWDLVLDGCEVPCGGYACDLRLPLPPLIAVDEVEYLSTAGVLTPWTAFQTFGVAGAGFGRIRPAFETAWPAVRDTAEAMRVRFRAGYAKGNGDSPEELVEAVPYNIKAAIRLMIGDLYGRRETAIEGPATAVPMSTTVENLLNHFRAYTWG